MLKLVSHLFSYFAGKYMSAFKSNTDFLTESIILKIRKISLLLGLMIAAAVGIALSGAMALQSIGLMLDSAGFVYLSGFFLASVGGLALFAILFAVASRKKFWVKAEKRMPPAHKASAMEEALSLLIMDFVKEREFKRDLKLNQLNEKSYNRSRQEYRFDSQDLPSGAMSSSYETAPH